MPIYEYECKKCGALEINHKISDTIESCPNCGMEDIKKIISKSNFQLKGTGWYETDFKSNQSNHKK